MTGISRRSVVKYAAAALAVGAGTVTTGPASGGEPDKPAAVPQSGKPVDDLLARARQSPESFMLGEPETFALNTDGHSRDMVITSARDEHGDRVNVYVPSRSVRIFRADAGVDEFTAQGGLHWRFWDKPGKVMLRQTPGAALQAPQPGQGSIVMVVRDEETVRVYTMTPDFRC